MDERRVLVKNLTRATVVLNIPSATYSHTFKGENSSAKIPFSTLYEGFMSEEGVPALFEEGILYIEDKQDRIDLDMEDEDAEQVVRVMSAKEMEEILSRRNAVEIKKTLTDLAAEQRKKFVDIAIQNEVYSPGIAKIIQDETGVDMLKAINAKHIMESDDKTEIDN